MPHNHEAPNPAPQYPAKQPSAKGGEGLPAMEGAGTGGSWAHCCQVRDCLKTEGDMTEDSRPHSLTHSHSDIQHTCTHERHTCTHKRHTCTHERHTCTHES